MTQQSYTLNEVKHKVASTPGLSMSKFYHLVMSGDIEKHPDDIAKKRGIRYGAASVDKFLRGEFSKDGRRNKSKTSTKNPTSRALSSIDVVQPDDLPALYFMEIDHLLDWQQTVPSSLLLSWLEKNNHLYWMQFDPKNRRGLNGIRAVLGVLPLKEEIIQKLLHGEITLRQITANDILPYISGEKYSCFITSTTALPGYEHSVRLLLQYLLAYWCEQSIQIDRLYVVGPEIGPDMVEPTSLIRLVTESFFALLELQQGDSGGNGSTAWSLLFNRYNPALFVQEYQKCIQRKQSPDKKGEPAMIVNASEPLEIERELEGAIKTKLRDFSRLDKRLYKVDSNGRLDAERLKQEVWFRRIRDDDDIRACLRINASLFGDSKKYTEDELVAQRRIWLERNPDIYRVLEVDNEVVGFISAFPLPDPTLRRILHSEIRMGDVGIDELQVYKPGAPVSIYLQTIGVHIKYQGLDKRHFGGYMASGFRDMVNKFGRDGIELQAIYTRSDEIDGINLAYGIGFQKMPPIPGVDKLVFELDFSRRDLPFLFEYQQALAEYQTRHSARAIRSANR